MKYRSKSTLIKKVSVRIPQNIWLFFMLIFWPLVGQALGYSSVKYQVDESQMRRPSVFEYYQIGQVLKEEGFVSLYDGVVTPTLRFDQVYVSYDFKKTLLFKAGLRVDKSLRAKVISDDKSDTQVFHFQANQRDYLVVGLGFTQIELQQISLKLTENEINAVGATFHSQPSKWAFLRPPPAQASVCLGNAPSASQGLYETKKQLEENEILKGIGRCALSSFNEVKDAMEEGVSFFKNLATDPRKLWGEMKESYIQFKSLVMNIKSEVQQMIGAFEGLTTEQKVQLACGMAGVAMGVVVKSVLGGATSLLTALPAVTLKLKSLSAMMAKVKTLSKFGIRERDRNAIAEKVMSCAR